MLTHVSDEASAKMVEAVTTAMGRRHLVVQVWLRDPTLDALVAQSGETEEARYQRAAAALMVGWRERTLYSSRASNLMWAMRRKRTFTSILVGIEVEMKCSNAQMLKSDKRRRNIRKLGDRGCHILFSARLDGLDAARHRLCARRVHSMRRRERRGSAQARQQQS